MTQDVKVTHRFKASPDTVYDAFLNAQTAGKFLFATAKGKMLRAEIDPHVGGVLTFVDLRDGEEVLHAGRYLELERPRRIVFEFSVPKYSSDVARVEIGIAADGKGSVVTLRHLAVPEEWLEGARAEWARILLVADDVTAVSQML